MVLTLQVRMSGYSIPYASEKSIKDTIAGYYRASSSGGEVSAKKAAEGADVSEDVARRQRGFLAEIGILEKGDSGYALTDKGQKIGRALRHDREDDAKGPFAEALRGWEATSKILDDLGPDYNNEEDVMDSIGFITDHELNTRRQQAGANGLIGLYEWTGILETNENGEYRAAGGDIDETKSESPAEPGGSTGEEQENPGQSRSPPTDTNSTDRRGEAPPTDMDITNPVFDISLELNGDEDPENVHDLIMAVRLALYEDIDEYSDSGPRSDGGQDTDSNEEDEDEGDSSLDSFMDD